MVVMGERRQWMLNDSDTYRWADELTGWRPFTSSL